MKTLALIISMTLFWSISYSQELETLGAGVIDFLLTNPKTARQTNPTEAAALRVIGNLLSISAQRKHDLNVARTGRNEIVINSSKGDQATMYTDSQGNLYLLYNGTIHPISQSLISQAKGGYTQPTIKNSTLPSYNLSVLKNEYSFEKKITYSQIFPAENRLKESRGNLWKKRTPKKGISLSDIADDNDISVTDIFLQPIGKLVRVSYPGNLGFLTKPKIRERESLEHHLTKFESVIHYNYKSEVEKNSPVYNIFQPKSPI